MPAESGCGLTPGAVRLETLSSSMMSYLWHAGSCNNKDHQASIFTRWIGAGLCRSEMVRCLANSSPGEGLVEPEATLPTVLRV